MKKNILNYISYIPKVIGVGILSSGVGLVAWGFISDSNTPKPVDDYVIKYVNIEKKLNQAVTSRDLLNPAFKDSLEKIRAEKDSLRNLPNFEYEKIVKYNKSMPSTEGEKKVGGGLALVLLSGIFFADWKGWDIYP